MPGSKVKGSVKAKDVLFMVGSLRSVLTLQKCFVSATVYDYSRVTTHSNNFYLHQKNL